MSYAPSPPGLDLLSGMVLEIETRVSDTLSMSSLTEEHTALILAL